MRNEFAKWEIKTSMFSGRKSRVGNCCLWGTNNPNMEETGSLENPIPSGKCYLDLNRADIRALADPESQADPKFQSPFLYTRITAKGMRQALIDQKGCVRTFRWMIEK